MAGRFGSGAGATSRPLSRSMRSLGCCIGGIRKRLIAGLCAIVLIAGTSNAARVFVHIAPPTVVIEHPGPVPHAGWVWVGGYWRWNGHRYVWMPGYWVRPPHPHALWVPPHWDPAPGRMGLRGRSVALSGIFGRTQSRHAGPLGGGQAFGWTQDAMLVDWPGRKGNRRSLGSARDDNDVDAGRPIPQCGM